MIKNILYVVSILIILAAAYFAFDTKKKIAGEMASHEAASSSNQQVSADIKTTESDLADSEGALEKGETNKAELAATKELEEGKTGKLRASIQGFEAEIEGYDAELIKFEEARKLVNDLTEGLDMDLDEIPAKITELNDKRKEQQRNLERLMELETKLTREVAKNETDIVDFTNRLADVREKISRGGQQGVITAVDSVWGFVVVNQGAGNSSVTERSELLVSRNGRLLGRLKVTSLEPNRAICDIDSKSFRPGVRLQTGDKITLADTAAN